MRFGIPTWINMSGLYRKIANIEFPPPVVAELSGNHNQNLDTAKKLIQLAVKNGASAVKLQTYTADTLTLPSRNPEFMIDEGLWEGKKSSRALPNSRHSFRMAPSSSRTCPLIRHHPLQHSI